MTSQPLQTTPWQNFCYVDQQEHAIKCAATDRICLDCGRANPALMGGALPATRTTATPTEQASAAMPPRATPVSSEPPHGNLTSSSNALYGHPSSSEHSRTSAPPSGASALPRASVAVFSKVSTVAEQHRQGGFKGRGTTPAVHAGSRALSKRMADNPAPVAKIPTPRAKRTEPMWFKFDCEVFKQDLTINLTRRFANW